MNNKFYVNTDYNFNVDFFKKYIRNEWVDSNHIYKEYMTWKNNLFFVQEIKEFDISLLREIKKIWNYLNIRPTNWRCNFFKVLPGGEIPLHIDTLSKFSIVAPITENTGELYFKNGPSILYTNMIVINTKVLHGVKSPKYERIVFHMGVHDIDFSDIHI